MPQYFTPEQANASLTLIRPLMARLMRIRDEILGSQRGLAGDSKRSR